MTLQQADQIRMDWGKFLELFNPSLMRLFHVQIPECFLPYPKDSIEKALSIVLTRFEEMGESEAVDAIKLTSVYLENFVDNEQGINAAGKRFFDPNFLKVVLPTINESQEKQLKYVETNVA